MSTPAITPVEKKWLKELTKAEIEPATVTTRNEILGAAGKELEANAKKIREGLTFEMEMLDGGTLAAMKKMVGMRNTMQSLDKNSNALKEIDTGHDTSKLKAISGKDLSKAMDALETISKISQTARGKLQAARYKEAGYDDAKLTQMREALAEYQKTKTVPSGGLTEKEIRKFEKVSTKIEGEVDAAVADEVWTPLVRQGAMPENLVPDRYSSMKKTFSASAQAYNARLEEYSKGLSKNDNILKKLGVGNDVVAKAAGMGQKILAAVPGGEAYKDHVDLALQLLPMVASAATETAGNIIKQEDAQNIVDGLLASAAKICAAAIPMKEVADIVSGSLTGAIAAGRAVRGLVERKPEAFLDSLSSAVSSAMASAGTATDNALLKDLTPMVVGTIKGSGQAAVFIKACKSGDKDAMKKAMDALVQTGVDTIAKSVQMTVTKKVSGDKAEAINQGIDVASGGVTALASAALADGGKVKSFAAALGGIANNCCKTYLQPPALGSSVGALINMSMGSEGANLIDGIRNRNASAVLGVFANVTAQSLTTAASGVKSEDVAKALNDASSYFSASMASLAAAADLKKAIADQDLDGINKASQQLFNQVGAYLKTAVPSLSDVDLTDDSDGDEKSGADDSASEEDKKTIEDIKKVMAEQDAILKSKNATAEQKKAAIEMKAKAKEELEEQREMAKEMTKDAETFSAMMGLSMTEAAGNPDDDGAGPPKLKELILQIQKDRKIFELVEKLSSMPLALAAKFFPPAGAAVDFKKFSFEVMKAVQHTRALLQWLDNAGDAQAAVSVQVHAMLSRVHMEKRQVLEHNVRAALAITAAVGQVVATVGAHAAPVGIAMTAGARAGEATVELLKTIVDETEMEIGWRKFQAALKDPTDRKKARLAIQENPTLAKYSMAWGALHGGDAIAKEALRKCGLNAAVLGQKDANVGEVQRYLEEMFNEDLVVLRAVPVKKDWYPAKKPVLTLRSWSAFLDAACKKADLAPNSGGAMSEAFLKIDDAEDHYREVKKKLETTQADVNKAVADRKKKITAEETAKAKKGEAGKTTDQIEKEARTEADAKKIADARQAVTAAKNALEGALKSLQKTAREFAPLNTDGEEHVEMREYLDALAALAELKLREVNGQSVALDRSEAA